MTVQKPFIRPAPDCSGDVIEVALAQLNAVRVTEDQIRHGFRILITAGLDRDVGTIEQLLRFAQAENLYPSDVAAEAIAIRAGWLRDFVEQGGDPEIGWKFERFAKQLIAVSDFVRSDPEDDEIPW